jgi:hypothetical protein
MAPISAKTSVPRTNGMTATFFQLQKAAYARNRNVPTDSQQMLINTKSHGITPWLFYFYTHGATP